MDGRRFFQSDHVPIGFGYRLWRYLARVTEVEHCSFAEVHYAAQTDMNLDNTAVASSAEYLLCGYVSFACRELSTHAGHKAAAMENNLMYNVNPDGIWHSVGHGVVGGDRLIRTCPHVPDVHDPSPMAGHLLEAELEQLQHKAKLKGCEPRLSARKCCGRRL